jgi:hypothetical protein
MIKASETLPNLVALMQKAIEREDRTISVPSSEVGKEEIYELSTISTWAEICPSNDKLGEGKLYSGYLEICEGYGTLWQIHVKA